MDFLNKAKEQLSGNNTNTDTGANTNMGQQQGGAVNNTNEDYGDKGKTYFSSLSSYLLLSIDINVDKNEVFEGLEVKCANKYFVKDLISSRKKPGTPWEEIPMRRSPMERGGCMRKLLGMFPFPTLSLSILSSANLVLFRE